MTSQVSMQRDHRLTWLEAYGAKPHAPLSSAELAQCAVQALIDEAELTPKPGLVDMRGNGAHTDLSLPLLIRSAQTLEPWFKHMADAARGRDVSIHLREQLGELGRKAELVMMQATGGVNAHRGAIWSLGLLVAAASQGKGLSAGMICRQAARLAVLPDAHAGARKSHGYDVSRRYGASGARGEAEAGFPHALHAGLRSLHDGRRAGKAESHARLDALIKIMATLEDTCLLHRGGHRALKAAQDGAARVAALGGVSTHAGFAALLELHDAMISLWSSPGGSADMLAATLFLDRVSVHYEGSL